MARFNSLSLIFPAAVLVCILNVGLTNGQLERCHTSILTPHHFLDLDRFTGRWYYLKIAPSKAHQVHTFNFTCASVDILPSGETNVLNFDESYLELQDGVITGPGSTHSVIKIGVVNPDMPIPAVWSHYYTEAGSNVTIESQSVVLASDETDWAIVYNCGNEGELLERIFIWSRSRTLTPLIEQTLDTIAYGIGFPYENFVRVSQSQC